MNKFNISNKLISFNKNNSSTKIPKIIKDLKEGKSIALVSDAGMPGICDPGEDVARQLRLEGIDIICVPGACAAIAALVWAVYLPLVLYLKAFFLKRKLIEKKFF